VVVVVIFGLVPFFNCRKYKPPLVAVVVLYPVYCDAWICTGTTIKKNAITAVTLLLLNIITLLDLQPGTVMLQFSRY